MHWAVNRFIIDVAYSKWSDENASSEPQIVIANYDNILSN